MVTGPAGALSQRTRTVGRSANLIARHRLSAGSAGIALHGPFPAIAAPPPSGDRTSTIRLEKIIIRKLTGGLQPGAGPARHPSQPEHAPSSPTRRRTASGSIGEWRGPRVGYATMRAMSSADVARFVSVDPDRNRALLRAHLATGVVGRQHAPAALGPTARLWAHPGPLLPGLCQRPGQGRAADRPPPAPRLPGGPLAVTWSRAGDETAEQRCSLSRGSPAIRLKVVRPGGQ